MSKLIVLEDYLSERICYGELFVKCLDTVQDDEGLYAIKGKSYEVLNLVDNCFHIDGEDCTLIAKRNDKCFKVLIKNREGER